MRSIINRENGIAKVNCAGLSAIGDNSTPLSKRGELYHIINKTLADNYEIQVITEADEINCPMQSATPSKLSARQFHQNIEKNWRVTSFSALQAKLQALYGEHLSDNAQDYSDNAIEIDDEETVPSAKPLSIYPQHFTPFDLPKGAGVVWCCTLF